MDTRRAEPPTHPADEDPVDGLVADCLARLSRGDGDPLEDMCAANPAHAAELRRRQEQLARLGLWGRATGAAAQQIGSFRLLRELGRGGMGVVWLAHQSEPLRRLAAVKVIGGRASRSTLARFEAERQALAMLVHPNIAQVLEAGRTDDGQPWYAMEFVDGVPLTAYCEQHRTSIDARLDLFLQLCEAVQFAHQQGVLHRDLKPGNVLVCERGGRPLVKVIDFGLAKALQEPFVAGQDLTEEGQILGTPEYMSPEQALPTAAGVDTRTDVYALGTILYELCTGVLPFDFVQLRRQGFRELQRAVCEQEAPAMSSRLRQLAPASAQQADRATTTTSSLLRRLRGDLDWIANRALAKERERRYPAVSELAADVRRHLRHEPVLAGPPTAGYQLRKFVRRHRAGVAVATTGLLGLVVALVVVLDLLTQRNQSLAGFDSLQVALDLQQLERRAERLWPAWPDTQPALDAWLADADGLAAREAALRAQLAGLEQQGTRGPDGWHFPTLRDGYLHGQLTAILGHYGPDGALTQRITDVRARRQWAATLRQHTLEEPAAAWQAAIATIADPGQCPDYEGLRIEPQLGFVPLGRDEHSRLYEFAFPQPGERLPERRDSRWLVADDTCMVFVLIPGGQARLGIDWPDPRLPAALAKPQDTEYLATGPDRVAGTSLPVRLDPFLLSKFEVSQAQWTRAMGSNPSANSPERWASLGVDMTHPVGNLSARMADRFVAQVGLELPTSAQWQHAARGRAEAPWWTGFELAGWRGKENLADAAYAKRNGKVEGGQGEIDLEGDDDYPLTAPVAALLPNPFGLHHVLGNVREWTRDPHHKYVDARPDASGTGAMAPVRADEALDPGRRDILGGSYSTGWIATRSTLRMPGSLDQSATAFGLRPSRALTRR